MTLVKENLKMAIVAAFDEREEKEDSVAAIDRIAGKLATAIDDYIKTGTVMTMVTTAGSATAQTGTGVGNIT
ncbi:hypothetical protein [Dokdonia sp.]|uniref:hypothetical protein n=1 Tax=Dokdonia sp. TaxID=2024995 RepID=UPI003267670C